MYIQSTQNLVLYLAAQPYNNVVGIKWLISSFIEGYRRRNRAGRIGLSLCWIGIFGMILRFFAQTPPGSFGGIPAILFITGLVFTFIGWLLSIIYTQRRL